MGALEVGEREQPGCTTQLCRNHTMKYKQVPSLEGVAVQQRDRQMSAPMPPCGTVRATAEHVKGAQSGAP
jgi:hypothetical protein